MTVTPLIDRHSQVIGVAIKWGDGGQDKPESECRKDLADMLRGCTNGFSTWSERPKWSEALLDFLRKEAE